MIKLTIALLVALCLSTCIDAQLKVYNCKSQSKPLATIKKLEISNATSYPIVLNRGENSTITMEFQTNSKITGCKLKIVGELNGKQVQFSATNDDDHCHQSIKEVKGKKK